LTIFDAERLGDDRIRPIDHFQPMRGFGDAQ
jgi:hypothetical protein